MTDIRERLARLEKSNRRLRTLAAAAMAVAVLAAAGAILRGGPASAKTKTFDVMQAKTVVAERFVVQGKDGKKRAELGLRVGGAFIGLWDADGKLRGRLAETGVGSKLNFWDDEGRERVVCGETLIGPAFLLYDPEGKQIWSAPPGPAAPAPEKK